ncbi:WXG100 family type VII secretion target [Nakamurella lactea]|uniref:WXG100 family type VII secretion target n=1 Tax=Nakamurella lactea TaxID=459515 RepID=UPI0004290E96|nr:hypothetical protein [Nakamurella lactea]
MTTAGVFAFDTDKAGTVETSLGTLITDLGLTLTDLDGFVTWVKSEWDGDEMEFYNAIHTGWKKNAETVQQILDGVHTAIGSVKTSVIDLRQNVRDAMKEEG